MAKQVKFKHAYDAGGVLYNPGERAAFSDDLAARLVDAKIAEYPAKQEFDAAVKK